MRPLAVVSLAVLLTVVVMAAAPLADNGGPSPTLSFFSGGNGAHADWFVTADQPPGDIDNQAIRLLTTNGAPTFEKGYAGILFHHVTGIPAADFPDSSFWNKTPETPYFGQPNTFGSPRLVVAFQNALGQPDGYADLRQNTRGNGWEEVSANTFPNAAWDVMGGPCVFLYNVTWSVVQSCFAGDTTLTFYLIADAYGIYHLIDDITVNGKTFSRAGDNGNGNNGPAGPTETTDPSLLPPILVLFQPQ